MITKRLNMGYERKGKVKKSPSFLALTTGRIELPFTEMSKIWSGFGDEIAIWGQQKI